MNITLPAISRRELPLSTKHFFTRCRRSGLLHLLLSIGREKYVKHIDTYAEQQYAIHNTQNT